MSSWKRAHHAPVVGLGSTRAPRVPARAPAGRVRQNKTKNAPLRCRVGKGRNMPFRWLGEHTRPACSGPRPRGPGAAPPGRTAPAWAAHLRRAARARPAAPGAGALPSTAPEVPKGRPKIAQRFNAGIKCRDAKQVPEGRKKFPQCSVMPKLRAFCRPSGTLPDTPFPPSVETLGYSLTPSGLEKTSDSPKSSPQPPESHSIPPFW